MEPKTAALLMSLGPLEVPMEPRAAAVEHVAAPVEPVVAPVDKGSNPSEAPEALLFSRGLPFLLAVLPHINDACFTLNKKPQIENDFNDKSGGDDDARTVLI